MPSHHCKALPKDDELNHSREFKIKGRGVRMFFDVKLFRMKIPGVSSVKVFERSSTCSTQPNTSGVSRAFLQSTHRSQTHLSNDDGGGGGGGNGEP